MVKNPPASAGGMSSLPGLGRSRVPRAPRIKIDAFKVPKYFKEIESKKKKGKETLSFRKGIHMNKGMNQKIYIGI